MPVWDLATRENWELILSESRLVTYNNNTLPTDDRYKYTPISPIYATPSSHTLLIGTRSNSARQHWFLGARASQYLYVSPSNNFSYTSGVQALDIKKIGLNRLTLVEFKNYNVIPYVLEIDIPYWLEDIYVEVWEYISTETDLLDDRLHGIENSLIRIEGKLDNLTVNFITPGSINTGFNNPDASGGLGAI